MVVGSDSSVSSRNVRLFTPTKLIRKNSLIHQEKFLSLGGSLRMRELLISLPRELEAQPATRRFSLAPCTPCQPCFAVEQSRFSAGVGFPSPVPFFTSTGVSSPPFPLKALCHRLCPACTRFSHGSIPRYDAGRRTGASAAAPGSCAWVAPPLSARLDVTSLRKSFVVPCSLVTDPCFMIPIFFPGHRSTALNCRHAPAILHALAILD